MEKEKIIGVTALLIHAAKIDEEYTDIEKMIIKNFLNKINNNLFDVQELLKKAEELELNSNQLLSFTNLIKKESVDFKSRVIEELWKIIISDNKSDQYEANLMRRICGLIYFPDKLSGEIKLRLKKEIK